MRNAISWLIRPLPWFATKASRPALLVWDAAWVLLYLGAVAFTAHFFLASATGFSYAVTHPYLSRWSLERLDRHLGSAWEELGAAYKRAAPDPDTLVIGSDPLPALRHLLASPLAGAAFYIGPDARIVVLQKTEETAAGGQQQLIQCELATWRPSGAGENGQQASYGPWSPEFQARRAVLRWHERSLIEVYRSCFFTSPPLQAVYLPQTGFQARSWFHYKRATPGGGVLGYWPPLHVRAPGLEQQVQAIFAAHGLGGVVAWQPVWNGHSNLHMGPQDLLPYLRVVDWTPLEAENYRQLALWLVPLVLALLGRLGGLGLNLRALWNERAIALAQSNFVSAVSHEMRTPLTTIQLYAEMLEQDVVTDPLRRQAYLRTISQECQRLGRLVENVLDYASISGKRKSYHFEALDARAVVEEALAAVAGPLEKAGMVVELYAPVPVTVTGDRDALVQSLVNLLGNAVKYGHEGGRVLVSVFPERGQIAITVEDFGPGIPLAEQQKIFQPFYRVGNELTRTTSGSGLGLALVAETAKAHQGQVELSSEPGRGSLFRLSWPIERA